MKHPPYQSIEDMTRPETLAGLVSRPIQKVRLEPCQPVGWSSTESQFIAVKVGDEDYPPYVLKRMVRKRDWVMQMTEDQYWRAVAIWQHGLLDALPACIDHAIIACAADGDDGYAFLMHNVTHAMLSDDLSEADLDFSLDAMAALHVTFWDDLTVQNPALSLCSPENLFTHTAPGKLQQLSAAYSLPVYDMIQEGWRLLPTFVDADVADLLLALSHNPHPLCSAIRRYPRTLVHGDWRVANFGIERGEGRRLVLLDWARPTLTAAAVDLAYFLVTSRGSLPADKQRIIEAYRTHLAGRLGQRFDEAWWRPMLDLSLLSAFLMIGCFRAWFAARASDEADRAQQLANLRWWAEQARAGAKWLVSDAA